VAVTDVDEWLHPGVACDEVTVEIDDEAGEPVLRASLRVTPAGRRAQLTVTLEGIQARVDADEGGPPATNWDRMRIGGVEWRMVEPLRLWELSADDPVTGLRAYVAFKGSGPCAAVADGYEQTGTASGQLQLGERLVTLTGRPGRRTHLWGDR